MNILELLGLGFVNPASGEASTNAQLIISLIRNGIILLFTGVIIIAIVYSALSGFKFIQSNGASEKVEEAKEAIKYTLIGVGVAFIGVVGVVLISSIFSPNTSGELSLRCFLGDTNVCNVSVNRVDNANIACNAAATGTVEITGESSCRDRDGGIYIICKPTDASTQIRSEQNLKCSDFGLQSP